jgi:predicted outer membrane repeat protein
MARNSLLRFFLAGLTCIIMCFSLNSAVAASTVLQVQLDKTASDIGDPQPKRFPEISTDTIFSSSSASPSPLTGPRTIDPKFIHVPADVADLQSAINLVSDGGIIELASGTYPAPVGGFKINDYPKGFTIRAATGAIPTLDGGGARDILRFQNTNLSTGRPVVFQGLVFANGYSATEGIAGGVTLYSAMATFVNCTFQNNAGRTQTTGGGGLMVAQNSTVLFLNDVWTNNSSRIGGGGMELQGYSKVFVHSSRFTQNITNPPNHDPNSGGGAIGVGNSTLRVSNTRFENNQAGGFGGAIHIVGNWVNPVTTPQSDVIVSNSTFANNKVVRDPSVIASFPTEGGAITMEDQSILKIYNSRFVTNSAMIAGAVDNFRASVEIYGSVFQGNQATDTTANSGFGGAISLNSAYGFSNDSNAKLTLQDTLIQGRYGAVTTVAQSGGCLFAGGDGTRTSNNHAVVVIRRVMFYDCDVTGPYAGLGGAIAVGQTNLTMDSSIIANSDAIGTGSSGGGVAIFYDSSASITNTTFIHNSSSTYGGALFVQGSVANITNSNFAENSVPGTPSDWFTSYGAAIFSSPDEGRGLAVSGTVSNSVFSNNVGMAIFDDDRTNGPINNMVYNGNQFYSAFYSSRWIYRSSLSPAQTATGLNSLVVTRSNGTSTDKSTVNNLDLNTTPKIGAILALPPNILTTNALGDSAPPTTAYAAYAWSGAAATLDAVSVSGYAGLNAYTTPGSHTLSVGSTTFTATIGQATTPAVSSQASPRTITSGGNSLLSWVISGTFLDMAIDGGVNVTPTSSGSVTISPSTTKTYYTYGMTQEGGSWIATTITVSNGGTYSIFLPMVLKP